MGTGNSKVNIFLKKFLTQQDMTDNFLDYLHNLILEGHQKLVPLAGLYTYPVSVRSDAVDTISFLTPGETNPADGNGPQLEGDDGHGRILKLQDAKRVELPVPNENGVNYFAGMKFNYYPNETEINVRTGKIKWSLFQEGIGERAEPNVVSFHNNQLSVQVDSICKGVDQVGRTVRVWLKEPVSQATGDVYEDVTISKQSITLQHDGGLNYFDVANELRGYFQLGQSITIDKSVSAPTTTTITLVGVEDSGGAGFTRISVPVDLSGYTTANGAYVQTGNNIVNLIGTLGQGTNPSVEATDYESFLYGVTVTDQDLRVDEYYVYLCNYIGQGVGNNPASFDTSDQRQITQDLGSIVNNIANFKEYQLQRNGFVFRGGGQFSLNSGVLAWSGDFQIVNPYRGIYEIPTNSISGIVNDDVLYTKVYDEQPVILNGNSSGEIWVESTADFENGSKVVIGDNGTDSVTGYVSGAPGVEKLTIVDAGLTPIDLSNYTTTDGAWVQRLDTELYKGHINEGELRPTTAHKIDSQVMIVAVVHDGVLIFKNGVLRLEDGDVGQISNLPSNFNWINTTTELVDSLTLSADGNVGILAPKTYNLTSEINFNKNFSWAGVNDLTEISGNFANSLLKIVPDPTTAGAHQYVELKNLVLTNLGAGNVLEIDNTGATKGIEVVLDSCLLLANSGLSIKVTHGEPSQYIKLKFINSRKQINMGSVVIESKNNSDEFIIDNVLLSPSDTITFGEATADPTSSLSLTNSKFDQVIALGSGNAKTIDIQDCYSWNADKKIEIEGEGFAQFSISQIIVDHREFSNYAKSRNSTIMKVGKPLTYAGGTLTWTNAFEFTDAYYGVAIIEATSLPGIANNDILYTKIYKHQYAQGDGNASGEIEVEDGTKYSDNDMVLIGDKDSILISGYVMGAPVGNVITVDDGAGTPIDISGITSAQGAWIIKTNLTLYKSQVNVGDLKPDELGNLDEEIYVIAKDYNGELLFSNGDSSYGGNVYEEQIIVDSPIAVGDAINLPPDSRQGGATKFYNVGTGDLTVFVNGVKHDVLPYELVPVFDPVAYNSGTGIIDVLDSVNLGLVRKDDKLKDVDGNEFVILGEIDNTPGQKKFKVGTGLTINLTNGSTIVRQGFSEVGGPLSNQIEARIDIPVNASIIIRVIPVESLAVISGGGGGGAGTLQEAYNGGSTITVVSGVPIVISGPVGEKLFRVLGDIEVTGVVDPKGMTLTRNVAKPWSSDEDGIWVDNTGNLNYYNKDTDSNETVGGFAGNRSYNNSQPSALVKGMVVTKAGVGNMQYADYNTDELSRAIGILLADTSSSESGEVKDFGWVESGVITASNFVEAVLPADRARVWLHASGKMTVTPPLADSGLMEVILGVWNDGGLSLQIQFLGQA